MPIVTPVGPTGPPGRPLGRIGNRPQSAGRHRSSRPQSAPHGAVAAAAACAPRASSREADRKGKDHKSAEVRRYIQTPIYQADPATLRRRGIRPASAKKQKHRRVVEDDFDTIVYEDTEEWPDEKFEKLERQHGRSPAHACATGAAAHAEALEGTPCSLAPCSFKARPTSAGQSGRPTSAGLSGRRGPAHRAPVSDVHKARAAAISAVSASEIGFSYAEAYAAQVQQPLAKTGGALAVQGTALARSTPPSAKTHSEGLLYNAHTQVAQPLPADLPAPRVHLGLPQPPSPDGLQDPLRLSTILEAPGPEAHSACHTPLHDRSVCGEPSPAGGGRVSRQPLLP